MRGALKIESRSWKREERFHRSQKNVNDGAEVSLGRPTVSSRKTIRDAKTARERKRKKNRPASFEMTGGGRVSRYVGARARGSRAGHAPDSGWPPSVAASSGAKEWT